MKLRYSLLLIAWWLAACAPVQVGLETASPSAPAVTATGAVEPSAEPEATSSPSPTALPPTADVNTVTPSATAPSATPSATATDTPTVAPSATARPSATRPRPTATVPPPSPTPTVERAMISSFQADHLEADPGEPVVLTWATTNAQRVRLHTGWVDVSNTIAWRQVTELPPTGSYTVTVDNVAPAQLFRLEVVGQQDPDASRQVSIRRRTCLELYIFTFPADRFNCPASAAVAVTMVEQVFEHGRLVRVDANSWMNPQSEPAIFVLTEHGTWVGRTNTWHPGEPESDPSLVPPDGRYQPTGGFGELWRDELRDQFGWALTPEQAYNGFYQYGYAPEPGWETGAPGWYTTNLYLRLLNGDVARLVWGSRFTGQTWELLSQ